MKKVVSVNLNNKVYQMEEDAYVYLNTALNSQWNRLELETKIAALIEQKQKEGKVATTCADIVDILYQLGYTAPVPNCKPHHSSKRLYRQPEGNMIAGVCTGLGEYFEIDPVAVRVLFVIAFFFGSLGFWIYMALWLIVPKTPKSSKQ